MKYIITESQYNKILKLKRRLIDIMSEASRIIDASDDFYGDNFYGDIDFCHYYPTLEKYIDSLVMDIIQQYEPDNYDIDDIENFINNIGYETFVNRLMDMYGEKIENFYNKKTQDC
jgi:hypothetical protein